MFAVSYTRFFSPSQETFICFQMRQMIATITAGVTDMSGCRHRRKKKKRSLRYQERTAELLLIHTCTELTFTVSVIRFWKFNLCYQNMLQENRGSGGKGWVVGPNGPGWYLLPHSFFGGCPRKSVPLWGCLDQGFLHCRKQESPSEYSELKGVESKGSRESSEAQGQEAQDRWEPETKYRQAPVQLSVHDSLWPDCVHLSHLSLHLLYSL